MPGVCCTGFSLSLVTGGAELTKLCEQLSGTEVAFWQEHASHCTDIYLKRENSDLQVRSRLAPTLHAPCHVPGESERRKSSGS